MQSKETLTTLQRWWQARPQGAQHRHLSTFQDTTSDDPGEKKCRIKGLSGFEGE